MAKNRIEREKEIVSKMICIYSKTHPNDDINCDVLKEYACKRLDACVFGNNKSFCSKCTVHCYKPDMRKSIRKVMRYSGPRILFYYPITTIKHFLQR